MLLFFFFIYCGIGATIRTHQETECLLHAGFFLNTTFYSKVGIIKLVIESVWMLPSDRCYYVVHTTRHEVDLTLLGMYEQSGQVNREGLLPKWLLLVFNRVTPLKTHDATDFFQCESKNTWGDPN